MVDNLKSKLTVIRIDYASTEYAHTLELRNRVLRLPLGLKLTPQETAADKNDFLFACTLNNKVIGCFILTPINSHIVKMRQVAVDTDQQKLGVGRTMSEFAEAWAKNHHYSYIELHARKAVEGFYKKLGYQPSGDIFIEVGIAHIKMKKQL